MTARDRRALVWGASVIIAAFVALRVLPGALRAASAWHVRAEARQEALAHTRRLLASVPQLEDSLRVLLPAVVALAPHLVDGRTPSEASASLASLIALEARRHALSVVRVDPLPGAAAGVFTRVAVHAEFEGDVRGLVAILQAIETGEPILTVESVSVDAPEGASPGGTTERLRIEITVAGYGLPRGPR